MYRLLLAGTGNFKGKMFSCMLHDWRDSINTPLTSIWQLDHSIWFYWHWHNICFSDDWFFKCLKKYINFHLIVFLISLSSLGEKMWQSVVPSRSSSITPINPSSDIPNCFSVSLLSGWDCRFNLHWMSMFCYFYLPATAQNHPHLVGDKC